MILLALTIVTVVAHSIQTPSVTDGTFLSPDSTAGDGGADLAAMLRSRGVTVRPVTSSEDAITDAQTGEATVFVPAPSLLLPDSLNWLATTAPFTVRVVLVDPSSGDLRTMELGAQVTRTRWSVRTEAPGCAVPEARNTGPVGIDGREYAGPTGTACYDGGLFSTSRLYLAGASDPFRNDRVHENGNARLSTALLSAYPTVIWLKLHHAEIVPAIMPPNSPVPDTFSAPTDTFPGSGPSLGGSTFGPPGDGATITGGGSGGASTGGDQSSQSQAAPTLRALFPPWVWTAIGLIVLAALGYALARSRRLGPPVPEPLPVVAHGREAIEGRARLYRHAGDPTSALRILQRAALRRIPRMIGVEADLAPDQLLEAVAERSGRPIEEVRQTLQDVEPANDTELAAAVQRLDRLMHDLTTPGGANR
ncbi:MAG TPA: DUF4350 domain-containing protein [Micromonosporaceae bacterium]